MSLWASQPYKCTFPTWQLCQAQRATLKVGVTCLPYFQKYVRYLTFCTSGDFWWFQAGFHKLFLSDIFSSHQCNSMMRVMSSWSQYLRSYKTKCHYKLLSSTNTQVQHDSCVRLKELPSKLGSHAYLIFRNKWDISCFAALVSFSDFQQGSPTFYVWPYQQSSV